MKFSVHPIKPKSEWLVKQANRYASISANYRRMFLDSPKGSIHRLTLINKAVMYRKWYVRDMAQVAS
ncbi:hypothetical protein VPHK449_0023 [Vibrio phage K449]|nr:hypothetical protein SIPHO049v1_p0008 [Vibrio phage PS14A.1]